jgi:hypothetical protein
VPAALPLGLGRKLLQREIARFCSGLNNPQKTFVDGSMTPGGMPMKNKQPLARDPQRTIRRMAPASFLTIGVLLVLIGSVVGARQYRKIKARSSQPILNEVVISPGRQETNAEEKVKISVEDGRPVATAITMLEARFGWVITYEDPRYTNPGDISDVTEKVRRDLHKFKPGRAPKVLVPKGGPLVFEYDYSADSNQNPDPNLILEALLAVHTGSGNAGRFRLERGDQIFHVVPTRIKDISGKFVSQKSVLDVAISIPAKERNGLQMLEALCAEVSKSVQLRVVVGMAPYGLFLQHKENQEVESAIARDVLVQLLERAGNGTRLSWQLFYDPGLRMYALNIHRVG